MTITSSLYFDTIPKDVYLGRYREVKIEAALPRMTFKPTGGMRSVKEGKTIEGYFYAHRPFAT